MNLSNVIVRDVSASRPTAGIVGRLFFSTDEGKTYRDSGTAWQDCTDATVVPSQPYDVVCSLAGKPSASQVVLILTFTRTVTFAANWSTSRGTVGANPTATATYTVAKNGSSVGTVVIATGGTFTFATSGGTSVSFAAGDRMTITAPSTQDATLSDVGITLAGTR